MGDIAGMKNAKVIKAHQASNPQPLVIRVGDRLTVGENSDQWPAYVWCVDHAGKGGWVPEAFLEREGDSGVALRDYSAAELTVAVGDELALGEEAGGWFWATNHAGRGGWVPAEHLIIDS
jgi:hypothetical protein